MARSAARGRQRGLPPLQDSPHRECFFRCRGAPAAIDLLDSFCGSRRAPGGRDQVGCRPGLDRPATRVFRQVRLGSESDQRLDLQSGSLFSVGVSEELKHSLDLLSNGIWRICQVRQTTDVAVKSMQALAFVFDAALHQQSRGEVLEARLLVHHSPPKPHLAAQPS